MAYFSRWESYRLWEPAATGAFKSEELLQLQEEAVTAAEQCPQQQQHHLAWFCPSHMSFATVITHTIQLIRKLSRLRRAARRLTCRGTPSTSGSPISDCFTFSIKIGLTPICILSATAPSAHQCIGYRLQKRYLPI